ncbi:amino acid ABC transporter permease [Ruminococcaceae bacterium OttesenSCG-928-L11]|nr:amino acid ABC transporter permease [Ruminococcaceae bacterium OttesenSCG-928-L11]
MSIFDKFYQAFFASQRYLLYLEGLGITLAITACSIVLGTVLGIVASLMKLSEWKIGRLKLPQLIATVYIDVIRGTPVMVQLLIMYMVVFTSPSTSKVFVSIMAFGINSGAYIAEIIRAGIMAVDPGQMEAGRSLGLSKGQTMQHIILPQAVKNILPTYANEFIVLIKETAVVGYIGLQDLTKMSSTITSRTYEAMMPLLIIAAIYLMLTMGLSRLFGWMERRLRRSDRG